MAIQKITYTNKVAINTDSSVPDINKCKADDLNEIKSVVNNNADEIPSNDKLVNVGTSVDSNYRTNILSSRNLLDLNNKLDNCAFDNTNNIIITSSSYEMYYIPVKEGQTYVSSANLGTSSGNIAYAYCNSTPQLNTSIVGRTTTDISILNNGTFTAPSNVKYLLIRITKASQSVSNWQIEKGSTASTHEPFIQKSINVDDTKFTDTLNVGTDINSANRVNILYSHNIFIPTLTNNGIDIQHSNCNVSLTNDEFSLTSTGSNIRIGEVVSNGGDYINTAGILYSTNGNQKIYIKCTNTDFNVIFITTYGSDKKSLGYTQLTSEEYTFPANAVYFSVRFGLNGSTIGTTYKTKVMVSYTPITTYEPYLTPSINVDGEEIYNANVMNYSTNEARIGTWIDGKPIYRKTFTGTKSSDTVSISCSGLNIDKTWEDVSNTFLIVSANNVIRTIPMTESDSSNTLYAYYYNNNWIIKGSNNQYYNGTYYFTIKYTKTTD